MAEQGEREQKLSQSRRSFLAQSAAVVGAGALLSTGAVSARSEPVGKARARASLREGDAIRMGVIGTGGMGTGHCQAFLAFAKDGRANVQIVAVSDVCEKRMNHAHEICEREQGITVDRYGDYRDMLARDDIHGVLIASPEHWHAQMAEDALLAGKDVYLEKPMTLRLDGALRLYEVVRANPQQIFQVGTQMIMLPKYQKARQAIADGMIGKPVWSQTSYCRNSMDGEWLYYAIDPDWEPGRNLDWARWCGPLGKAPWDPEVYARWRRYRKYSTGIIGDLLVHVMTPLIYSVDAGWPTRVVASGGHYVDKAMENHDQVNLNAQFENDHTMVVAGSTANEVGLETLIRGHEANIYLGGRHCEIRPERLFAEEIESKRLECPDIGNDQDQLRLNWLECIRTREPAASTIDLATKVMVIVDLATRSMWDGHAYTFDPSSMRATQV